MGLRQWPLDGSPVMQFYSGGFGEATEDCRRLLRHIARWSQRRPELSIEAVIVYPVASELTLEDAADPATWAATVLIGTE